MLGLGVGSCGWLQKRAVTRAETATALYMVSALARTVARDMAMKFEATPGQLQVRPPYRHPPAALKRAAACPGGVSGTSSTSAETESWRGGAEVAAGSRSAERVGAACGNTLGTKLGGRRVSCGGNRLGRRRATAETVVGMGGEAGGAWVTGRLQSSIRP